MACYNNPNNYYLRSFFIIMFIIILVSSIFLGSMIRAEASALALLLKGASLITGTHVAAFGVALIAAGVTIYGVYEIFNLYQNWERSAGKHYVDQFKASVASASSGVVNFTQDTISSIRSYLQQHFAGTEGSVSSTVNIINDTSFSIKGTTSNYAITMTLDEFNQHIETGAVIPLGESIEINGDIYSMTKIYPFYDDAGNLTRENLVISKNFEAFNYMAFTRYHYRGGLFNSRPDLEGFIVYNYIPTSSFDTPRIYPNYYYSYVDDNGVTRVAITGYGGYQIDGVPFSRYNYDDFSISADLNYKVDERLYSPSHSVSTSLAIPVYPYEGYDGSLDDEFLGYVGNVLDGKTIEDVESATPDTYNPDIDAPITQPWNPDLSVPDTATINFEPLKLTVPLTTVFPFSIPFDLKNAIENLNAPRSAPYFRVDFLTTVVEIDFSEFEQLAKVVRWGVLITFNISLIIVTRRLIKG